jgi:hypothetical protein
MEDAMSKRLVTIVGALVILSESTLPFDRAEAGASASAPSKYSQTKPASTAHVASTNRHIRSAGSEITEYSSSSAKTSSVPKR